MVGAIDVATNDNGGNNCEEVADTFTKALEFVDAENLYPCTNCVEWPCHALSQRLLNALHAGAEIIRKEIADR